MLELTLIWELDCPLLPAIPNCHIVNAPLKEADGVALISVGKTPQNTDVVPEIT